jgi:copper transport protein
MRFGRIMAVGVVACAAILATASPASAHAELLTSSPAPSSVLLIPPPRIVLHFDESVTIDFGSVSVLALDGRRVDEGGASHPGNDGSTVVLSLPNHLDRGTYVVGWRVISDDSHPVHGAYVFSVGTAASAGRAASVVAALEAADGSTTVGVVYGIIRFATFAGLLVLVGLATVLLVINPQGWQLRRIRRILWCSWTLLLAATIAGIAVQGVYAAALPLSQVFSASLFGDVLGTRFGEVQLLRMLLLLAVIPWLVGQGSPSWRRPARRAGAVVAAGLGIGLLLTPGLAGHASTIGNATFGEILDVVHLGAAAVWLGGLVLLGTLLLPGLGPEARSIVPSVARRFAPLALGAVVAVVATGTVQLMRRVGSWYALLHTSYGRILIVKVAVVAVLVAVAAITWRRSRGGWLRARTVPTEQMIARRLPPQVLIETGLMVGVLVAASLLVNAVPARQAAAQPFTDSFAVRGVEVNVLVAPATVGPDNLAHFYVLGRLGQPMAIAELDASISLPSAGLRPKAIPLAVASPGHYQAEGIDIPVSGSWRLIVTVRTTARAAPRQFRALLPVH